MGALLPYPISKTMNCWDIRIADVYANIICDPFDTSDSLVCEPEAYFRWLQWFKLQDVSIDYLRHDVNTGAGVADDAFEAVWSDVDRYDREP